MINTSRIFAVITSIVLTFSIMGVMPMAKENIKANAEGAFSISVDGNKITKDSLRLGAISANNSSRLLMDYKEKNPDAYWEIMNYLFNKETGIGLSHIKIELGSDCDSSSGTEPATMRAENEDANVNRGAGFHMCADAKTINPDISLDMLRWGSPKWTGANSVTNEENMAKRFKWYKNTLDAAYDEYGLKFDYISPDRNETSDIDVEWIKYLRKHLDSAAKESGAKYDYSQIKLVASDEVGHYKIADEMMNDSELSDAVDVLGFHYSTWSSENALKLKKEFGKEIWYSEGSSVTIDPKYAVNATNASGKELDSVAKGKGLTGVNGPLEIAVRVLNMYAQSGSTGGGMTMYEFQPAVAAYYTGAQFVPKQLILADTPWSGHYEVQVGTYIMEHFTRFQTENMKYVDGACYGDGIAAGDGHGIGSTTNNYITLADPKTGDYTMVFVNDTSNERTYNVSVSNLNKANSPLTAWVTKGPDVGQAYDANWLKNSETITPENGNFTYTVEPYSIVTLTTTTGQKGYDDEEKSSYQKSETDTNLSLPYTDDFNYSDEFIKERGGTPLYTCDAGGAFEVVKKSDGSKVLKQKIDSSSTPFTWGGGSSPTTTFGDTEWADYSVSADVKLDTRQQASDYNFAGVGLRSVGTCDIVSTSNKSGYWISLAQSGKYQCLKANTVLSEGTVRGFDANKWYNLKVSAVSNEIVFYVNNTAIFGYTDKQNPYLSGRAGLYSSYYLSEYDNLRIEKASESITGTGAVSFVERIDPLDSSVKYSGNWTLKVGDSFRLYNRTSASTSEKNASLEYTFNGTGVNFVLGGTRTESAVDIELDGVSLGENIALTTGVLQRQSLYYVNGLSNEQHTIKITVKSGYFIIDCIEVLGETHKTAKADIKDHIGEYPPTTQAKKVSNNTAKKVTKPAKVKNVRLKVKKKKKMNVSWKKVSGATGYEVKAATNNKFTKGKKKVTVKKNKVTIKNLKPKKKYFVKVRAYKLANGRKYFGKWSKVVKKKTK